jgi:hypothetical protein
VASTKFRVVAAAVAVSILPVALVAGPTSATPSLGTQQLVQIPGPDRTGTTSWYGSATALSADGLTALVADDIGQAAPGIVPAGAGWVQVLARASTADPFTDDGTLPHPPVIGDWFGTQVALSADGRVAIVETGYNAPHTLETFERTDDGWDGPQILSGLAADVHSIALDGDGTTAIIGDVNDGPEDDDNMGSVHVLHRAGASWTQLQVMDPGSPQFNPPNPAWGKHVSLSADGLTAAFSSHYGPLVTTRATTDDVFSEPTPLLLGAQEPWDYEAAIAIDPHGETIAATNTSVIPARAAVWTRTHGGGWLDEQVLTAPSDASSTFGSALTLSGSGDRLAVGDEAFTPDSGPWPHHMGRVSVYERSAGTWDVAGTIMSNSPHEWEHFGSSESFSDDGATLLIGSYDWDPASSFSSAFVWSTDAPSPDGMPHARDDSATVGPYGTVVIDIRANDGEADLDTTIVDTASAHGGSVTVDDSTGVATYTPPDMFAGADTFAYTTCDDDASPHCSTATVTITVSILPTFTPSEPACGGAGKQLLIGDFTGDRRSDVFAYATGPAPGMLCEKVHYGSVVVPTQPVHVPHRAIIANFDGNLRDDILWWTPGSSGEVLWRLVHDTFVPVHVPAITGAYTPVVGDFDGDGLDDVLWYAPGAGAEQLWHGTKAGFSVEAVPSVSATFTPLVGDYDGNGRDDVLWYAPGGGREALWRGATHGFAHVDVAAVAAAFTPRVGDFDGDNRDDVLWYAPGSAREALWHGTANGFTSASVPSMAQHLIPAVVDFNGDGHDDVYWYSPGIQAVMWRGGSSGFTPFVTLSYSPRQLHTGDFNRDGRTDALWHDAIGGQSEIWYGHA